MSDARLVCVTERALCTDDFMQRLARIAAMQPRAIILREKDLDKDAFLALAKEVQNLCVAHGVCCILNWRNNTVSLPGTGLQCTYGSAYPIGSEIPWGVSLHDPIEARALQNSHASWLIAGHVYPTSCKPGILPRGVTFLKTLVAHAAQPVYAIGGITPERVYEVLATGAAGYCVRSPLMIHPQVEELIQAYQKAEEGFRRHNLGD